MTTWWEERTARVNEAIGIVSVQADCSTKEALHLLQKRAERTDSDLEDVALAVNGRRLSFPPPARTDDASRPAEFYGSGGS